MENDTIVGCIDMLMIANSLLKKGYFTLKQDIKNHEFIKGEWTETVPSNYIQAYNPYCITHYCSKNDNSALSDQLFDRLNKIRKKQIAIAVTNPFNKHPNAIDEYSIWMPIKDSPVVKVTAFFYDKHILLNALNTAFIILNKVWKDENT